MYSLNKITFQHSAGVGRNTSKTKVASFVSSKEAQAKLMSLVGTHVRLGWAKHEINTDKVLLKKPEGYDVVYKEYFITSNGEN